jgi:hypothetical protein
MRIEKDRILVDGAPVERITYTLDAEEKRFILAVVAILHGTRRSSIRPLGFSVSQIRHEPPRCASRPPSPLPLVR